MHKRDFIPGAIISPCGLYRYRLDRWIENSPSGPPLVWLMANPSTADATMDDPTIRRVRGFTERFGYQRLVVVNVLAGRATKPEALLAMADPVGPENYRNIEWAARSTDRVICAWGAAIHPMLRHTVKAALAILRPLVDQGGLKVECLGLTASGAPRHPLMLKNNTPLQAYQIPG